MTAPQVLQMGQDLLYTALLLALPALLASLVVGLAMSVLQTITSIQEQTLSFVPRLVAVGLVLVFTMTWALQLAVHYAVRVLGQVAEVVR